MDDMEKRVKQCSEEKDELAKQIEQLESQNKSLAGPCLYISFLKILKIIKKFFLGQLRRLHQYILNGGAKQTQTSTAMMVLLLSTAFFLLPGFKDQHGSKLTYFLKAFKSIIWVHLFLFRKWSGRHPSSRHREIDQDAPHAWPVEVTSPNQAGNLAFFNWSNK